MLNEYSEYADYTIHLNPVTSDVANFGFKNSLYGRLQLKTLKTRDGIRRILTIIARRFIHHDLDNINEVVTITSENVRARVELGLRALQEYTSSDAIESPLDIELLHPKRYGKYFGYLLDIKELHRQLVQNHEDAKALLSNDLLATHRSIYHDLSKAANYWKNIYVKERLAKDFYGRGAGMNSKYENLIISFDLIVADALHLGPLRHHMVLFPVSIIERLHDLAFRKYAIALTDFLYTAALYVTLKQQNSNDYQVISYPDISNWMRKSGYYKNFNKFKIPLQKSDLFDEDIISNQSKKIFISDDLLTGYVLIDVRDPSETETYGKYITISDEIPYDEIEAEIKRYHASYRKSTHKKSKK